MTRLSSSAREKLYDAEAAKAKEAGLGDLPLCNICGFAIDGTKARWDASHDPSKPRWLGGAITGIAHSRCNARHAHEIDTPLYAKSRRQRWMNIGAKRSRFPMQGGRDDRLKKRVDGTVVIRNGRQL